MDAVNGARFSIYSKEADEVAERLYANIRKRSTDCYKIYKNTSFSIEQVQIIKNYIFNDSHNINVNGRYMYRRFFPSYDIAESWKRLSETKPDNILKHDIMLLCHELTEIMILLKNPGYIQKFAHDLANEKYNYQLASDEYYRRLGRL